MINEDLRDKIISLTHKYKNLSDLISNKQPEFHKPKKSIKKNNNIEQIDNRILEYNFYFYKLKNMGHIFYNYSFYKVSNLPQKSNIIVSMMQYTKHYIEFLTSVDLTDSKDVIKELNIQTFINIFSSNYFDCNIEKFILKFVNNTLTQERIIIRDLAILIYQFCYLNNKKQYLKKLAYIIKRDFETKNHIIQMKYNYKCCDEYYIDLILIISKEHDDFYDESIFLNNIYRIYNVKNIFIDKFIEPLMKRICKNIKRMKSEYVISFVKTVFLFGTVLFNLMSHTEILQVPFTLILKKQNVKKGHVDCLMLYFDTLFHKRNLSPELYEFLVERHFEVQKENIQHSITYQARIISSMQDILNIVIENKDSCANLQKAINEYNEYASWYSLSTNPVTLFEFIELNLSIWREVKYEYVIQFNRIFIRITKLLMERIDKLLIEYIDYNLLGNYLSLKCNVLCDQLSYFIMQLDKNIKPTNSKKKKVKLSKNKSGNSEITRLIEAIRKLEYNLSKYKNEMGILFDIRLLKDRSFQIITNN